MLDLNKVREKRIEKGLSQKEIANLLGISNRTSYTRMENGLVQLKATDLEKIAQILGEPISYFFDQKGDKIPQKISGMN